MKVVFGGGWLADAGGECEWGIYNTRTYIYTYKVKREREVAFGPASPEYLE